MAGAAEAFFAFNDVAQYVKIVKASPSDVYRYHVVGIDGKVCSRGNLIPFILDRAEWWENHYAAPVPAE
jgi:hypothetical protein